MKDPTKTGTQFAGAPVLVSSYAPRLSEYKPPNNPYVRAVGAFVFHPDDWAELKRLFASETNDQEPTTDD